MKKGKSRSLGREGWGLRWETPWPEPDLKSPVFPTRMSRAARRAKHIIGRGRVTGDPAAAAAAADIVFIAVPDGALPAAVARLCAAGFCGRGKTVFHTSGLEPASRLSGWRNGERPSARSIRPSLFRSHPLPRPISGERFSGWKETPPPSGRLKSLVRALGGRSIVLASRQKTLYHAACVLASNLLPPLVELAVETMMAAGVPAPDAKKALLPLVEGTLRNVKVFDAPEALTGPLARLDFGTIERQLKALRRVPRARAAYRTVGLASLELLKKRGAAAGSIKRLRALLEEK